MAAPASSGVRVEGPWRHREVSANGMRFHAAEMGDDQAPLVLLLHGFPQFWWSMRHQLEAVAAAGYRAVAPDLRGYGDSDKPPRGYDATRSPPMSPAWCAPSAPATRSSSATTGAVTRPGVLRSLHPAAVRGIVAARRATPAAVSQRPAHRTSWPAASQRAPDRIPTAVGARTPTRARRRRSGRPHAARVVGAGLARRRIRAALPLPDADSARRPLGARVLPLDRPLPAPPRRLPVQPATAPARRRPDVAVAWCA